MIPASPPTGVLSRPAAFESISTTFLGLGTVGNTASASVGSVKPAKSSAGLSGAAAAGLGVTMGILAFLVTAGVLWAVFGRNVRGMRRGAKE